MHINGKLVPWFKPAADVIRLAVRKGSSSAAIESFAALIEGGWWTQASLHSAGLALDPFCKWCGLEHGTLWHRVAGQCHVEPEMRQSERIVEMGRKRWWDPLFARGIPAHPLLPLPPVARVWNFPEEGYEGLITGNIYIQMVL